jgi:hypothetical protein
MTITLVKPILDAALIFTKGYHPMRIFLLCFIFFSQYSFASFDWSDYSDLLEQHVVQKEKSGILGNLVNYDGIAQDPRYAKLIESLSAYDTSNLAGNEKLAFYINTYNIFAIKLVIDHQPRNSIKDIGSWFNPVWQKPVGVLAGKMVSLDKIEHKVLRKMGEPRIHFAIVCASLSCPDLRTEAYSAERIEHQLDEQTKSFLANEQKGLRIDGKTVYVSKIFDWFSQDFDPSNDSKGVLKFIAKYNIEAGRFSEYKTLNYDWHLNKQ